MHFWSWLESATGVVFGLFVMAVCAHVVLRTIKDIIDGITGQ